MSLHPYNDILVKGPTNRYPLRIKTDGREASDPDYGYGEMRPG